MKSIFVTEKSSVAEEYARILGVTERKDGYLESDRYIITWCVGHLVTMSYPEKYDEKLKKWSLDTLPFLPEDYLYEVIPKVAKQFNVIKKLYHRDDVTRIYYAGDSGREGAYIQALVRQEAGVRSGIEERVVWIDSQTDEEIKRGIREAKPYAYYENIIASGYERAIEDYSTGINYSRILSLKYAKLICSAAGLSGYTPVAVGRVMTCVLGMVVRREMEIKNFKKTEYYRILNKINKYDCAISAEWKVTPESSMAGSQALYDNKGFLKKEDAYAFINRLPDKIRIESVEKEKEKKNAPTLFNLAELQAECTKKFKISPDETLAVAQKLYEYKMTTYPRTDARVLSSAIAKVVADNVKGLKSFSEETAVICDTILDNGYIDSIQKRTRYVDDTKITDHYAIIPTGHAIENYTDLNDQEKKVYELIMRRFLSIFYPPAVYYKVTLNEKAKDELFVRTVKVLQDPGYMKVAGLPQEDQDARRLAEAVSNLTEGMEIPCSYSTAQAQTSPPARYTSGSMVLAMENAGNLIEEEELRAQIKSNGIGTSATRAETIKKLVRLGYLLLNKKTQILTPAPLGYMVYEVVDQTVPSLLNPRMTASWEKGLQKVADGELEAANYRKTLIENIERECGNMIRNDYVVEIKKKIAAYVQNESYEDDRKPFQEEVLELICPVCGKHIKTAPFGYCCEGYKKDGGCTFAIGKIAGVKLTKDQMKMLITEGQTEVIEGFVSKSRKKFAAALNLQMDAEGKPKLSFDFSAVAPKTLSARCPKCGGAVRIAKFGYCCENYVKDDPNSCHFGIGTIAGKKLSETQATTLIKEKKTNIIKGFKSKSGKSFDAALKMDAEGKISFDFPERTDPSESDISCPKCGKLLIKDMYSYNCTCGYKIYHRIAGKAMTDMQMKTLITTGKLGRTSGFKSKKGKSFTAGLVCDENGTITFKI